MNPIALAQSFLMDIAAGMVTGDEMRDRARLLARELEAFRSLDASGLQALRYIARPTMGLTGEVLDLRAFVMYDADEHLVRLALATCIDLAQAALDKVEA